MNETFFFGFTSIFFVVWIILLCIIVGAIIYRLVSSVKENVKNNNSPILDVSATVVSKRMKVSWYGHHNSHVGRNVTAYYVTFQFDSGDRMELKVNDNEYGMLVESDKGTLKFQGTRYIEFNRDR